MSIHNGKDYLYLIWKSNRTRKQYVIAQITKNGQYEFTYCDEVHKAIEDGYTPFVCFPDLDKKYTSNTMFSVFSSRLPDRKRKNIKEILEKYGLKEYDEYLLLKRSGARLPIDAYEFIDPIFDINEKIQRIFYLAGVRHYMNCDGTDCSQAVILTRGDEVFLKEEPTNQYDENAIMVMDYQNKVLGYIPRYYSEGVTNALKNKKSVTCHVYNVEKNKNCNECVKLILKIG